VALEFLGRTLEDVSRDAEYIVRSHIINHLTVPGGEEWIAEGLSHTKDDTCPFCGRPVDGLALLSAYGTYFSDSYRQFQDELARYRGNAARLFSDERIELLRGQIIGNDTAAEF
jgi:wobble nucleotide-excising tRNase